MLDFLLVYDLSDYYEQRGRSFLSGVWDSKAWRA